MLIGSKTVFRSKERRNLILSSALHGRSRVAAELEQVCWHLRLATKHLVVLFDHCPVYKAAEGCCALDQFKLAQRIEHTRHAHN